MLEANKKILYFIWCKSELSISAKQWWWSLSMWLIVPLISIPYFAHTVYSIASATNIVTLYRKLDVCVCTVDFRWGQCTREHFAWPKVFFVRLCLKYISKQSRFFYMANRWNLRVFLYAWTLTKNMPTTSFITFFHLSHKFHAWLFMGPAQMVCFWVMPLIKF